MHSKLFFVKVFTDIFPCFSTSENFETLTLTSLYGAELCGLAGSTVSWELFILSKTRMKLDFDLAFLNRCKYFWSSHKLSVYLLQLKFYFFIVFRVMG